MRLSPKTWLHNGIVWLDEGLNSLAGGAPDETISSRLARWKDDEKRPKRRRFARVVCWLLDKIDPGHCDNTNQYERDITHRPEALDDQPGD